MSVLLLRMLFEMRSIIQFAVSFERVWYAQWPTLQLYAVFG